MCAKSEQPDPRDRAMDRLLAGGLKSASSFRAADSAVCPDAALVAAYADQGLTDGERAQLENHFADCKLCQQVLATLGAALEAPVGESVAVMPAPAAAPLPPRSRTRPAPSPQRWLWWLSPAFGAAAAALLWMVLRPGAPPPVQTAADYSRATAEQATDTLTAQANLPASTPEGAVPRAKAAEGAGPGAQTDKLQAEREIDQFSVEALPPGSGLGGGIGTARRDESVQSAPTVLGGTLSTREQAPTSAAAATAAPSAPPVPQQGAAAEARGNASDAALAQNTFRNIFIIRRNEFSSPDGSASWRVGVAGRIERSTDRGQTWQLQASGVTAELLAGSAVSNDVVWVVGRAGVILRTTNGQQWQRVTPPGGAPVDWGAVTVRDAMSATVVSAEAVVRRFSTEDGGRTWTQQQ